MATASTERIDNIVDDALVELVETLESIDEHQKLAKLNETSILDSSGGRIRF